MLRSAEAQDAGGSIHRRDAEAHRHSRPLSEREWDSLNTYHPPAPQGRAGALVGKPAAECALNRVVFGWNPYWVGTAYRDYDYSLVSDICYFSYEVNPTTGSCYTVHNWMTTDMVPLAKAAGTRVHLCATLFSGHTTFLGNPDSRNRMIDSMIALLKLRGADGVNIDFEGMPASVRGSFTAFITDLSVRLHAAIPGSMVSIALPAVDWSNVFDVAAMLPYVDLFLVMGYDYHWGSAPEAGPVAPKNSGGLWGTIDVTRSVYNYLGRGIPPSKLCLAVPYYGYEWPTADSTVPSRTIGQGSSLTYAAVKQRLEVLDRRWDPHSSTPYYIFPSDPAWKQGWYEDAESLSLKYDLVLMKKLAGIGIWALSYDGPNPELWEVIESHFTGCAHSPCQGTLADMGGAAGNYLDNDSYTFTIAPENAASVRLAFYSFNIADDRLRIFDGPDTLAPLLGSFTGEVNPGAITASSGAMTLAFGSNAERNSWGWVANWSCTSKPQGTGDEAPPRPLLPAILIEPNPVAEEAAIRYALPSGGTVELVLHDMLGRRLAVLESGRRAAGEHSVRLDRKGLRLASGSYLVQLRVDSRVVTAGVVLR